MQAKYKKYHKWETAYKIPNQETIRIIKGGVWKIIRDKESLYCCDNHINEASWMESWNRKKTQRKLKLRNLSNLWTQVSILFI